MTNADRLVWLDEQIVRWTSYVENANSTAPLEAIVRRAASYVGLPTDPNVTAMLREGCEHIDKRAFGEQVLLTLKHDRMLVQQAIEAEASSEG